MGLAITVFVPEGVIIASDGIAEIKNSENDNGFIQKKQKTMFSFANKYLICVQGLGYLQGLPYAFYIENILKCMKNNVFSSTKTFAESFSNSISKYITEYDRLAFYIAGVDEKENEDTHTSVYLLDNKTLIEINKGDNGENVYNYHSIGRNYWINKLLLPTVFTTNNGEKIPFENVEIDFSKYSIDEAIDFSKTMINFSHAMDNYSQFREMIGEHCHIGILKTFHDDIKIIAK